MAGTLAEHLARDVRYEPDKATLYQVEVEMFVGMLSAMKQTCVVRGLLFSAPGRGR